MRRIIALVVSVILMIGATAPVAYAGTSTNVALGLASFAVFNQLVTPLLRPRPAHAAYRQVIVERPVYALPQTEVVVVQPAPRPPVYPAVVQYPHGRYELRGDGLTMPYLWVWIPSPPPPPPPPPPPTPYP